MEWKWLHTLRLGEPNSLSPWVWAIMFGFVTLYALYWLRGWRVASRVSGSVRGFLWKGPLRLVYFALLVMALLGPSFGKKAGAQREVRAEGKDVFFVVDISKSMDAEDVSPSRLQKVSYELKNVVNAFPTDRIGLIMFAGDAYMLSPPTFDKRALNIFIESLRTNLISSPGTAFGPALRMALEEHLKEGEESKRVKKRSSKVIVLVSDGEDFSEETIEAAEEIADSEIRLYTLGVGTRKGANLREGYGYKRDPSTGEPVLTALDPESLQRLAEEADGRYFEISAERNDTQRLIREIASLKGETLDAKRMADPSANKYLYLLVPAFLLLCVDTLWAVKTVKI